MPLDRSLDPSQASDPPFPSPAVLALCCAVLVAGVWGLLPEVTAAALAVTVSAVYHGGALLRDWLATHRPAATGSGVVRLLLLRGASAIPVPAACWLGTGLLAMAATVMVALLGDGAGATVGGVGLLLCTALLFAVPVSGPVDRYTRVTRTLDGLSIGVSILFALWLLGLSAMPAGHQPRVFAVALLLSCALPVAGLDALAALPRHPPAANRPVGAVLCILGLADVALAAQGAPARVSAAAVLMIFGPMLVVFGGRQSVRAARSGVLSDWPLPTVLRALCHAAPAIIAVGITLRVLVRGDGFDAVAKLLGLLLLALLAVRETHQWLRVRNRLAELNRLLARGPGAALPVGFTGPLGIAGPTGLAGTDTAGTGLVVVPGPGWPLAGQVSRRRLLAEVRGRLGAADRCGALLVVDVEAAGGGEVGLDIAAAAGPYARLTDGRLTVLVDGGPVLVGAVATQLLEALTRTGGGTAASVGIAELADAGTPVGVLNRARLAQERAARQGTGVEWFDAQLASAEARRRLLLRHLPRALERDEFDVRYRPVIDLESGRPIAAQVMLRWHSPDLGPVPASEFIPAAEETGDSGPIGLWTLGTACRQLSRWLGDGRDLWLVLRLGGRYLLESRLVDSVRDALAANNVPASRLVLEATGDTVTAFRGAVEQLDRLRGLGVRTCLLGTGPTGLALLRQLPVDMLKLTGAAPGPALDAQATTRGLGLIDRVARRYGVEVLVDGVSGDEELARVRTAGCRWAAGPVFGEPLAAERFEALLRDFGTPARPATVF
jgi:EAL domain-containing protein (putative c-di-GMP-specific phosphodiesterase class I)